MSLSFTGQNACPLTFMWLYNQMWLTEERALFLKLWQKLWFLR